MLSFFDFLNARVFSLVIPLLLLTVGGYFLFCLRAFLFVRPRATLAQILPKAKRGDSFRALTLALAGTLGVGNLVGVATALHAGGAGAVFWIFVSALFSAMLKYAETVLAVHYRVKKQDGTHGGVMYYLTSKLHAPILSVLFCLLCIGASFFIGNVMQLHAVAQAFSYEFSISPLWVGVPFALMTLLTTMGGGKRIMALTYRLIPLLSFAYLFFSLAVVLKNAHLLPQLVRTVLSEAFSVRAAVGGACGYGLKSAVRYGVARGLLSNEAGCGTAPIAHAASVDTTPVRQGCMGILEVVVDTVLLCGATALVILLNGDLYRTQDAMPLALASYGNFLGAAAERGLALALACFALASVVGWSFYACECIAYLSRSRAVKVAYLCLYSATCVGAVLLDSTAIWSCADFFLSAMTLLQTTVLLFERKTVRDLTKEAFPSLFLEKNLQSKKRCDIIKRV